MKHRTTPSIFLAIPALLFSFFLMFYTFSYSPKTQTMYITSKLWSDFGAHIPLIRSFSRGPNLSRLIHGLPIESPLFPGEPIRYHFGFYALVGALEKAGLPIDWALNIPSALGFFLLLVCIFFLSYALFSHYSISLLSVLFFLLNGSLSFITYFSAHPLNVTPLRDILTNSRFPTFGPWDGNTITAFWNFNIYTNQRHLGLSYALALGLILCFYHFPYGNRKKISVAILLVGALVFVNFAVMAIAALFIFWFFVIQKRERIPMLLTGLCSILPLVALLRLANTHTSITLVPGYLAQKPLTPGSFLSFWFANLGLHMFLIPLGVFLSSRPIRRVFGPPLAMLFILPNVFQFSADMINNHKFFNFFLLLGNMFSAYAVIRIIAVLRRIKNTSLRRPLQAAVAILLIGVLTLSGVIDFFPIFNDYKGGVTDQNPDVAFFASTPPEAVVANSTWFYHPASLAGRAIFSGYTYFTWSYGYAQGAREKALLSIYQAPTLVALCKALQETHVAYVELNPNPETYLNPNMALWNRLQANYTNLETGLRIYSADTLCLPL